MAVELGEKERAAQVQAHAAKQRAKEEANRKERQARAQRDVSVIVHSPVRT